MSTTDATTPTRTGTDGIAWLVTLVLAAGLIAVVVIFAFSQNNTPASIDGTTATTSHLVDE